MCTFTMKVFEARRHPGVRRLARALLLSGLGVMPAGALAQEPVILRFSSYQPEQAVMSSAIKKWAEDVTKSTNGKVNFTFFWGSSLLSAVDTPQGVRDGRTQVGLTAAAYIPSRLPLSTVDTIPFETTNVEAFGRAFWDTYKNVPALKEEFAKQDFVLVAYLPAAANTIYSKTPIRTYDDLKNLRVRAIGFGGDALKAAGANPVALPQDQVYDSLSKGVINATSGATLDIGVDFGFHSVAPYVIDPNYGVYAAAMVVMNRGVYEKLDAKTRAAIDAASDRALTEHYLPELRTALQARCDKAKAEGAKVYVWPQAETDKWQKALGDAARARWIETVSKTSNLDAAKFLADYEARIRDYEKKSTWRNPALTCASPS
jgi:TRAP-type C4-dicarboxylate transport system substrate-binding protein